MSLKSLELNIILPQAVIITEQFRTSQNNPNLYRNLFKHSDGTVRAFVIIQPAAVY